MNKPIIGEEREKLAELLQPIADLKPGDRVQWKRGMKDITIPQYDEVVEVFRLKNTGGGEYGTNHACDEIDFTILFRNDNGGVTEFAFDSRRFKRVE